MEPRGRRGRRQIALGVGLLAAAVILAVVASGNDRPRPVMTGPALVRGDAARSGVIAAASVPPPVGVRWVVEAAARHDALLTFTGALTADAVYAIAEESLHAFDLASGALRWRRQLPPSLDWTVVAGPEIVVVFAWDSGMIGIDPSTGEPLWRTEAPAGSATAGTSQGGFHGVPVAVDRGRVVMQGAPTPAGSGAMRVLDALTGEILWHRAGRADFDTNVSVAGVTADTVLLDAVRLFGPRDEPGVAVQRVLVAIDLVTGQTRWETDLPPHDDHPVLAVTVSDGRAFLAWEDRVEVRDAVTGTIVDVVAPGDATVPPPSYWRPGSEVGLPGLVTVDPSARVGLVADGYLVALEGETERWRAALVRTAGASLLAGEGRLVVAEPGAVASYDASGDRQWIHRSDVAHPFRRGVPPWSGQPVAAVVDDLVVAVRSGRFREGSGTVVPTVLDLATGLLRWQDVRPAGTGFQSAVEGRTVQVAVSGRLMGFDLADGDRLFDVTTEGLAGPLAARGSTWYLSMNRGGLTVGIHPPHVIAVDTTDQRVRWRVDLAACTDPVVADDRVLIGTPEGLVALAASSGAVRWEAGLADAACWEPSVRDGTVVVAGATSTLHGLDLATGTPRWAADVGAPISSPVAIAGDEAYLGTAAGEVVAVLVEDGDIRWRFDVGAPVDTPPVLLDGYLAVLARDGRLLLLD